MEDLVECFDAGLVDGEAAHHVYGTAFRRVGQYIVPLFIVVNKHNEVGQIVGLNDAVLKLEEDLVLMPLEARELQKVGRSDTGVGEDALSENILHDFLQAEAMESQILEDLVVAVFGWLHVVVNLAVLVGGPPWYALIWTDAYVLRAVEH